MKKILTVYYSTCVFLASTAFPISVTAQVSFAPVVTYSPGGNGFSKSAAGDINGDGKPDLLTANDQGTIGVLLGSGTGTFASATTYSTGLFTHPYSIALGDINQDGKLDAVTSNEGSSMSVLVGTGTGGFSAANLYSTGVNSQPQSIVLGDVNGDRSLDVAIADVTGKIVVLLNDGNGHFPTPIPYSVGALDARPEDVVLRDFNGDGYLDIATTTAPTTLVNGVAILLNNGRGSFLAPTTYSTGADSQLPTFLAVGDVNGDGKLDIATSNTANGSVSVLINNAAGGFNTGVVYNARVGADDQIGILSMGDINGDGKPDIIVPNQSRGLLKVLLNTGNGTYTPLATTYATGVSKSNPFSSILADLNADGKLDVVTSNFTSNNLGVLLNTSSNPLAVTPASSALPITLYPNPAQATTTIAVAVVAGVTQATMQLTDALGRGIRTAVLPLGNPYELDLHSLKSGVYFLRFQIKESITVQRLIVN
ncbi:MAG: T9SS type A sorting domain-containing protein [Janthinobacterium lividum]